MKRIFAKIECIMLMLVCAIPSLAGQDNPFRIGFQVSPVFSSIRNSNNAIVNNGGNLGWKLGLISDIHFKNKLSFTAGVNFAFTEGGELLYEVGGNYLPDSELSNPLLQTGDKPLPDGVKIRYKLHYLEFPVGLKYRTEPKGNITYFFEAPIFTFSFLTKGRGDIESEDFLYEQENIFKDLVVANIFLGLGVGLEYEINRSNSFIGGIYYQRGLLDVTKNNGWSAVQNPNINKMYLRIKDDSHASIGNLIFFIGLLF